MSLTRRDLLGLLLGAPLAAQACRRTPRAVAGSIRGGAMTVGHRLRDATVERASGPAEHVDVVIVGSGPAGLSAAWRLERLGIRSFVVLELEAQPGGTSAWGTDGVVPYPWGAHYVPVPGTDNHALITLLDEIGALEPAELGEHNAGLARRGREGVLVRQPEERLFFEDRWHEGLFPDAGAAEQDVSELRRFEREVDRWVVWRDARGRRAFELPLRRCSDDAELTALDRISASDWLEQRGLRSERLRWYVGYACRDDYGLELEQTSAWAMLFYFAARKAVPGQDSAPFLTWPEGNGRLVSHLAAVSGSRLRTGQLVTDAVPHADFVEVAALDVRAQSLRRYEAKFAILAVPQFVAARVVRPWRERPPDHLRAFTHGAWLVANLHLRRRPGSVGFPFAWDNVLYDSRSLGYVVATHQRLSDFGPTVWTYYRPLTDADPGLARQKLAALDHGAISAAVLADLGRAHHGLDDAVERIDAWRWGHAMVRPVPGFLWGGARRRAADALGRMLFAHSDLSGISLFEEAQDQGVRAAEAVARAVGREVSALGG
jgi:phytoene dehydrogenase-like protein